MSNLQTSQEQQENSIQISKQLTTSLALAFERTGTEPNNLDLMIRDITTEFNNLTVEHLTQAIRNGGLGKYGRTYKLTTQEVCVWIRSYLLELQKNKFSPYG